MHSSATNPLCTSHCIRALAALVAAAVMACTSGCQSTRPLPPVDVHQPGWSVRHGQALWRPARDFAELAGELLVAGHPDGRALVQFTKAQFPILTARREGMRWQIHFAAEDKTLSRKGEPPPELIWLRLDQFLRDKAALEPWEYTKAGRLWRIENRVTGESLEGFLRP